MITRNLSVDDTEKVYDAFMSVAISRTQENPPSHGFYDYPLTLDDFKARLYDSRFSIALEDRKKLLAYILAYPFHQTTDMDIQHDLVLSRLKAPEETVYADQLFMKPGLPLFIAGRFFDTWTNLAWGYIPPGVVCAIPQKPWKNVPSTRFVLARGFNRQKIISSSGLELAVYAKPFWELGEEARKFNVELKEETK